MRQETHEEYQQFEAINHAKGKKNTNSVLCVPWLGEYVLEYEVHLFLKYRLRLPQRDKGFINWYLKQNQLIHSLSAK